MDKLVHKIGIYAAAVAGGLATRALLEKAWEAKTAKPAPKNPAADDVTWSQALLWGASAGVLVGVARTAIRKSYVELANEDPEEIDVTPT